MLTRKVFGYHPYWAGNSFQAYDFALLSHVAYFSAEADPATGNIAAAHDWATTGLMGVAQAAGVKPVLTATNMGGTANAQLLSDPLKRAAFIRALVTLAAGRNAAGINVDFEMVPGAQRANFSQFVSDLGARLRARVPEAAVSVTLPAIDWAKSYDGAALAADCDYLVVMAYDYHWTGSPSAGPVAPLDGPIGVRKSIETWIDQGISPRKLLLGVPYYGYGWPTRDSTPFAAATGSGRPVLYKDAKVAAALHGRNWDVASSSPWYAYQTPTGWRQVWYEDAESLTAKYLLVNAQNLGGVALWALTYDGPNRDLWDALQSAFAVPGL
ncbi:MAG: glycosyl hydrolase family 18 protein [Bryobacteraceae bacterium]